ncbi:MAG: FG-GAP repeat protein [Saprospiraceae bacterium]|nr:FG-GAP repeat protein [Saprospiraceae bacterium]
MGNASKPTIGDVNGDGLGDLIIGETNNELNYFENVGSIGNADFNTSPTTTDFGKYSRQAVTIIWKMEPLLSLKIKKG